MLAVAQFFANGGSEALIVRCGREGLPLTPEDLIDPQLQPLRRGLWALDQAADVNLMVIPPLMPGVEVPTAVWNAAIRYAAQRRAFVLVDAPSGWNSAPAALAGMASHVARNANAALYFPWVAVPSSLPMGQPMWVPPSAMVAGVMARIDTQRGVWKAPAGSDAALVGASGLAVSISEAEQEALLGAGLNVLREYSGGRRLVWSARTLAGAEGNASQWKYVSVRRLFMFVEESIDRGLEWVAFEPNDAVLWHRVRRLIEDFLLRLWRQGALLGVKAEQAFFVRCDGTTMTQEDIDTGRLNVEIGVALLRPGEFVIFRLESHTTAA
jgi:phage tail sheath protein FI